MQNQTDSLNSLVAAKLHLADVVLRRLYKSKRFAALDRDDAESVAQVAVWQAVESHDPALSTLDAHVKHRVRLALLDAVRKTDPPAEDGADPLVEELCDHNHLDERSVRAWRETQAREQTSDDLRAALDTLTVRQARVVSLLGRGHTQEAVREALGVARRKFRDTLDEIRGKLGRFRPYVGSAATVSTDDPSEGGQP